MRVHTLTQSLTHSLAPTTRALLQRVVGDQVAEMFDVEIVDKIDNRDFFEYGDAAGRRGRVLLRGTTGVAVASALNWYLRCDGMLVG
jgi:alpha-N-acetylglucosaminidase